jgi:hypothetical protein
MDLSHTVQVAISPNRSPEATPAADGISFSFWWLTRRTTPQQALGLKCHRPLPCRQASRRDRYANTR